MIKLNIVTLNVRGFKADQVATDALNYNLDILGGTETHLKGQDSLNIQVNNNNKSRTYTFFMTHQRTTNTME